MCFILIKYHVCYGLIIIIKTTYLVVQRSRCVCDRVMLRHLFKACELPEINIYPPDVKRPKGSLRQLLRRKSSFHLWP